MSSAAVELASRVRLSDPKPDRCSGCFAGPDLDTRFVDFDSAVDRGQVVHELEPGVVHHRESLDDLHLCEACVRAGAEALGLRPELHSRQVRAIRQLELQVEHWRGVADRLRGALDKALAAPPGDTPKPRGRR